LALVAAENCSGIVNMVFLLMELGVLTKGAPIKLFVRRNNSILWINLLMSRIFYCTAPKYFILFHNRK